MTPLSHSAYRGDDPSGPLAAAARLPDRIWSELLASDPGLLRLRGACRATLSVTVAAALLGPLAAAQLIPVVAAACGITFALMASGLPREPARRERALTCSAMAVSGLLGVASTAAAATVPFLGEAWFLLVLFWAVAFQSRGPRFVACGLVAVVMSYLALFLHTDLPHVPSLFLVLPTALGIVLATTLFVLPERPREALARIVRTVERRGATLLHAASLAGPDESPPGRLRRRRLFADLTETILAAEDQLALLEPEAATRLSLTLIRFELALIQVGAAALATSPLPRRERARIRLAAMRLNSGRQARSLPTAAAETQLGAALDEVDTVAAELASAALPLGGPRHSRPGAGGELAPLAWRPATRAFIAAFLSMAGGYAISPDRWFWAVLTAYLLFLGARSNGETIVKGVQRVWGSVIGLMVGVLVTVALAGHPILETLALLIFIFAMNYVFAISQTIAIFCVTVLLGLIYSLVGIGAETVLILRLEETAIGAAAAILVGLFVLPRRTRDFVHDTGASLLRTLAEVLRLAARRLSGDASARPVAAMRQADREFRDLRAAVKPLQARHALAWWARAPAELPAILTCLFWARVLASASESEAPDGFDIPAFQVRAERLAAELDGLAEPVGPTWPRRPGTRRGPVEVEVGHLGQGRSAVLAMALGQLEGTLGLMAERFGAEGWSAVVSRRPI